jgi:hypothetical protein
LLKEINFGIKNIQDFEKFKRLVKNLFEKRRLFGLEKKRLNFEKEREISSY